MSGAEAASKLQPTEVVAIFQSACQGRPRPTDEDLIALTDHLNRPWASGLSYASGGWALQMALRVILEEVPVVLAMFERQGRSSSPSPQRVALETLLGGAQGLEASGFSIPRRGATPPRRKQENGEWHRDAEAVRWHVTQALRNAGWTTVDVGKPNSPALQIISSLLGKLGHSKSEDALVKAFQRRRQKDNSSEKLSDEAD